MKKRNHLPNYHDILTFSKLLLKSGLLCLLQVCGAVFGCRGYNLYNIYKIKLNSRMRPPTFLTRVGDATPDKRCCFRFSCLKNWKLCTRAFWLEYRGRKYISKYVCLWQLSLKWNSSRFLLTLLQKSQRHFHNLSTAASPHAPSPHSKR